MCIHFNVADYYIMIAIHINYCVLSLKFIVYVVKCIQRFENELFSIVSVIFFYLIFFNKKHVKQILRSCLSQIDKKNYPRIKILLIVNRAFFEDSLQFIIVLNPTIIDI